MSAIEKLQNIMQALRDPEKGCPWDLKQNFRSLVPYTIEEAYEVADAIERNDMADIKNELGDLLFQVVFYAQLGKEQKAFGFEDIAEAISEKLVRRHPHVFAEDSVTDAEHQTRQWEQLKAEERREKAQQNNSRSSILDDVSRTLPSLMRAEKLQKRAAREGFDWPDVQGVIAKVEEELDEVQHEVEQASVDKDRLEDEIGDLFFSCVNLARYNGIDAETALRNANLKFEKRFRRVEKLAEEKGRLLSDINIDELEALWQRAKLDTKKA